VAVITKLVKGFDPDYPFKQQGRWAWDYFDVRAEPRSRWLGVRGGRAGPAARVGGWTGRLTAC
jgi:hypothetical protein